MHELFFLDLSRIPLSVFNICNQFNNQSCPPFEFQNIYNRYLLLGCVSTKNSNAWKLFCCAGVGSSTSAVEKFLLSTIFFFYLPDNIFCI